MSDEKHRARNKKYLDNTVDSIMVRVPKGKKAKIQAAAKEAGKSLNKFCADAILEKIPEEEDSNA